jgi:hypothetical protein
MIYREPGFLSFSVSLSPAELPDGERGRGKGKGRGRGEEGEEPNHSTARKPGPL